MYTTDKIVTSRSPLIQFEAGPKLSIEIPGSNLKLIMAKLSEMDIPGLLSFKGPVPSPGSRHQDPWWKYIAYLD